MSKFGTYVDNTLTWIGNNKLATLFGLLAFILMVSTWALADTNGRLRAEIADLKTHTTEAPTTAVPITTVTGTPAA